MAKKICANCRKEIDTVADGFTTCRDNFIQANYFEEEDGSDNVFCSIECACESMMIEHVYDETSTKRKWAIYKTGIGKSAREYVDNYQLLKDTHLYGVVEERSLPIILNRGLGYSCFDLDYEKKNGFIEVIENEDFPLSRQDMFPKNSKDFKYGWIDTSGNTYACDFEDHSYAAEFLCKEYGYSDYRCERVLEEAGWIKVSRKPPYVQESQTIFVCKQFITQAQYNALCSIGLEEDRNVRWLYEFSEPSW